ncbi:MAG: hypothetical protein QOG42_541, partial [Solirubrobacteraceae bacterium]|nr:hypothetical protein [Solirubrobacteraceae bacterium]
FPGARRPGRAVLALAAACALLATTAGAASGAAGARCAPPGPPLSANVDHEEHADGSAAVTEHLARGAYRVTRCSRDGRRQVSETVSPILDPDGGVALVMTERQEPGVDVEAIYGDPTERSWAADFRASRAARRDATMEPTEPSPVPAAPATPATPSLPPEPARDAPAKTDAKAEAGGLTARAAVASDACSNTQFTLWQGAWTSRNYGYYVNRNRFDWNDNTVTSLVLGHTNWDRTVNSCGIPDATNLNSWYLGSTASTVHTYPDGASITDRGDMAAVGCAGALACTFVFTDGAGTITETDQRFNQGIAWSNVGAAGAYDVQSIATHESGHSIGLHHANSSDALTMYYAVRAGTTHARTLAVGDVWGLRTRYP